MFELYPHQVAHVTRLLDIFGQDFYAMDMSMLGAGKTYTSTRVAEFLGVQHVVVVSPVSVKTKWEMMCKEHGLKLKHCLSFSELRSSRCKQPKHGLLSRRDYKQDDIEKVEFLSTPTLDEMVKEGCLLVIDEIQNIKNLSSQFYACRALISAIKRGDGSRVLLVSGSPIDKKEQTVHLFRCLGIMTQHKLCDFNLQDYTFTDRGFREIQTYCRELEGNRQPPRPNRNGTNAATCLIKVYRMFQEVLKKHRACAMDPPPNTSSITKRNGYFEISEGERDLLSRGVRELSDASSFDATTGTVAFANARTVIAITQALMMIETAKVPTFARLAREALERDPACKVVLCLNYTATLGDLRALLADYDPLVMNGALSAHKRGEVMSKFQAPDPSHRLLVGNVSAMSTGIDLDDKDGAFKRVVYVSPMYSTITLYQLAHRFLRLDTRSSTSFFMVYGRHASETRVIDALGRKSQIMKETTTQQVDAGVEFPGDFESFHEE